MSEQQIELKIQKGIREAEDNLVLWIQAALDKTDSYGKLEESQFRNLVRVADTTDSPEVIKNYLLYQVGRDNKWGRGKNSLAQKIINDINDTIKNAAVKISECTEKSEFKRIWVELIRRYLGYGARHLKYLNSL